ncbi:MAG: NYN domain-containing protein [Alphaproteobacteria bacterium]
MTTSDTEYTMALFCDFENVALGVRDAKIPKFDMKLVLERLLLKGSIVVKKAYCDWDRYKEFKSTMHETAFELIEIPHTRMSGKNSADIRMVVDALDLCYTKEHIDTFVVISGDSDFSPLVSKLRENAKTVIGVGVKNSTSDLLMNNCDEFIYYDDLARAVAAPAPRRKTPVTKKPVSAEPAKAPAKAKAPAAKPATAEENAALDAKEAEAIDMVVKLAEELIAERGGQVWSSMVKQTLKRRKPGFNESFYGFRSFSEVLEEAEDLGLLALELDDRSGGYIVRTAPDSD